jgi:hypothetical protein
MKRAITDSTTGTTRHPATQLALAAAALAMAALAGCFYPPVQAPPPQNKGQVTLGQPYDIVWDAVRAVIRKNKLRINAQDPNHGIIETETNRFTLDDADCGELKGIVGKYAAEPNAAATAVYNFEVKPKGREASTVSVQATFSAPLHIPLHPMRDVQCVSRGKAEARLLKEIAVEAAAMRRPEFVKPTN